MAAEEESIQQITSLERLDRTLQVVGFKGWMTLLFLILFAIAAVAWSVWGTIPTTVSGKCIVFNPDFLIRLQSNAPGKVVEVNVKPGDPVQEGAQLAVLEISTPRGQTQSLTMTAPSDGTIEWVDIVVGDVVTADQNLFFLQKPVQPDTTRIYAFLPLFDGQQVKVGMDVLISLDNVDANRYGRLRGTVANINPYPVSDNDYYMHKIPSQSLRQYLVGSTLPTISVLIFAVPDPATPSGLEWTSKEGPPTVIQQGSIGEASITLDRVHPLSFIIPKSKKS